MRQEIGDCRKARMEILKLSIRVLLFAVEVKNGGHKM